MDSNNSNANGMAVAALTLGIASIPTICCSGLGLPIAAIGIILALLSRRGRTMSPPAKIGFGLSLASLILTIIMMTVSLVMVVTSDIFKDTMEMMNQLDPDILQDQEKLEEYLNDYLDEYLENNYDYVYPEDTSIYPDFNTDSII